jgi:AcrR family transcriptional regulator
MEAAAKLISEKGYHETSMRDIAGELNMSAASLYHYFPGKEDLVVALQLECFQDLISQTEARLSETGEDPVRKLYAFVSTHMRYFVEHIALLRVLLHEDSCLGKANQDRVKEYKQTYVQMCETLIRAVPRDDGAPDVDPKIVVFSLFGMMNWYYTWQHSVPGVSGQTLADAMTQLFLRGYQSSDQAVPELVM